MTINLATGKVFDFYSENIGSCFWHFFVKLLGFLSKHEQTEMQCGKRTSLVGIKYSLMGSRQTKQLCKENKKQAK